MSSGLIYSHPDNSLDMMNPEPFVAQTSQARLLSCWPAVSTIANDGRTLCRSSRGCILAAALRLRCLAQSMQLAIDWMTVESTVWILTLKRRSQPLPLRHAAEFGMACWRWPSTDQNRSSANSALCNLLALERPFFDGA
jgi:hypothetical protein